MPYEGLICLVLTLLLTARRRAERPVLGRISAMKLKDGSRIVLVLAILLLCCGPVTGLLEAVSEPRVPLQPFSDGVREVERELAFYGQPLSPQDQQAIDKAFANPNPQAAVSRSETVLDKYSLVTATVNPEGRVDVARGAAPARLTQDGTRLFLVKVVNQAGITAPLRVISPNSGPVYIPSTGNPAPKEHLTPAEVRERWAEISLLSRTLEPPGYPNALPVQHLSGLGLEYRILMIYSRDAGQRSAQFAFDVGQGTVDFRQMNEVTILFKIAPARSITLNVYNEGGRPTMASFVFRDSHGRLYPNPVKRLAPDFYFQPQIYRANGESISLPDGSYTVTYTGGPEYVTETRHVTVTADGPQALTFHLKRWIDPAKYGWYSGDDHIHPAGCSHYEAPTEGVLPKDMDRQVLGEHLNVGASLIWGPCFYYQKQFFRGRQDSPASTSYCLLHYDLEVSGFPSSHCGHLVLLHLKHLLYPGTTRIDQWPTWDLPILRWAKKQGAVAGFAHSGWGLAVKTDTLPNYQVPGFDGIGANEYIVDVTYPNTVDFISAGDTPYVWELNIWYQTLNAGFRTRLSGETDFPCIYDGRVGEGRTYAHITGPLTYEKYIESIKDGAVYVSDGRSHLMNFTVNHTEMGSQKSEVDLPAPATVHVSVNAAAYLPSAPGQTTRSRPYPAALYPHTAAYLPSASGPEQAIRSRPYYEKPYWDLERARIGNTRKVPVAVVVNGEPEAKKEIVADGAIRKLNFDVPVRKSSWIAVRILPSSHTDPIFVVVDKKPICSRRSAEWCLAGVNQCWLQKSPLISKSELPAAKQAYDHARQVYQRLSTQCSK